MKRKFLFRRLIASVSALVLTASLLFTYVSAAADTDMDLERTLSMHDAAFGKKEECTAIITKAVSKKDIHALIIHFFLHNADYYYANGLNPDFPYFNADKYLQENPDVAMEVAGSREGALEHYLTVGALEGRSSCTKFDPIIAMSVLPEIGILTPEDLENAWIQVMGSNSTEEYILTVAQVEKYTVSKKVSKPAVKPAAGTSAGESSDTPTPAPIVEEEKTYTLMVYLCGTDLESLDSHYEATKTLIKILYGAYDAENTNVLILAGGTDSWKNSYLNGQLGGRENNVNKSAIYYVDKEGVKEAVDNLCKVNSYTVDKLYQESLKLDSWDDMDALFDSLINENTLKPYSEIGTENMGATGTLVSLLEAAKSEQFKADQYGLSLWNHGGGSMEGVCFPDANTSDGLEIKEIRDALQQADFGSSASSSQNKLNLLAFDACLMAGAETAAYLTDCYDMMYASEETTFGDIDYYNIIRIASQSAGDENLSESLAIAIFEDRYANYKGTENLFTTGALFKNEGVADSLEKLNAVAVKLNALAADSQKDDVFFAVKSARLKSEQLGSSAAVSNCKDYVDMKNFLQMLKKELNSKGINGADSELDNAIAAADEATYANSFSYCGQQIYFDRPGETIDHTDGLFWKLLKGMSLSGANIYVPYYSVKRSTLDDDLAYFQNHYANSLNLQDYNTFLHSYGEYLKGEQDRIKKLAQELSSGLDENENAVTGYSNLLEMSRSTTDSGDVVTITVKDYGKDIPQSENSSGDAFVDLCDTMDAMLMYITRRVNVTCVSDTEIGFDVVVGSKTVSYENLNGLNSTINIFTGQFDEIDMNLVKATDVTDPENGVESDEYDFITPSNIEGHLEKDWMIAALGSEGSEYLTVKGTAKSEDGAEVTAYHLFVKKENGQYQYVGSASAEFDYDNECATKLTDTSSITFYHQIVDSDTNKLKYAEEVEGVSKLSGAKEYTVGESNVITISSQNLKDIGSPSDNGYYFAISQNENTNDDDVFAPLPDTSDFNYTTTEDFFDVIKEAMTSSAAGNEEGNADSPERSVPAASEQTEDAEMETSEDVTDTEETTAADLEVPAASAEESPASVEEAPAPSNELPEEFELAA